MPKTMQFLLAIIDNKYLILYKRASRFVEVAYLLHLASLLWLTLFFFFGFLAVSASENGSRYLFCFYGYLSVCSILLAFIAQLDAYSRLQNYKLAKDLFFERGFQTRIVNLFVHSHCQREALKIAAIDLGIIDELNSYYASRGYRWFHLIPDIVLHKPMVLFTWNFWKKTLFVNHYKSKYFSW